MQGNGKSEKGKGKRRRSGRSCQPMEVVGKKVLAERLLPTSEVKIGDPAYCLKADRMRRKVDNVEFDCLFISRLSTYPCFSFFSSCFLLLCYPTVYTSSHSSILHSVLMYPYVFTFIVRGGGCNKASHTRHTNIDWPLVQNGDGGAYARRYLVFLYPHKSTNLELVSHIFFQLPHVCNSIE